MGCVFNQVCPCTSLLVAKVCFEKSEMYVWYVCVGTYSLDAMSTDPQLGTVNIQLYMSTGTTWVCVSWYPCNNVGFCFVHAQDIANARKYYFLASQTKEHGSLHHIPLANIKRLAALRPDGRFHGELVWEYNAGNKSSYHSKRVQNMLHTGTAGSVSSQRDKVAMVV